MVHEPERTLRRALLCALLLSHAAAPAAAESKVPTDEALPGYRCEPGEQRPVPFPGVWKDDVLLPGPPRCDVPEVEDDEVEHYRGVALGLLPDPEDLVVPTLCGTDCLEEPDPGCVADCGVPDLCRGGCLPPVACANGPCPLPSPPCPSFLCPAPPLPCVSGPCPVPALPPCVGLLCSAPPAPCGPIACGVPVPEVPCAPGACGVPAPHVPCIEGPCAPAPCTIASCALPPAPCLSACPPPALPCAGAPCPDPWQPCAGCAPPAVPCLGSACPPILCVTVDCVEYPCVNADCTLPPVACVLAACTLPPACAVALGCEPCFTTLLHCDVDARLFGALLRDARSTADALARVPIPDAGGAVYGGAAVVAGEGSRLAREAAAGPPTAPPWAASAPAGQPMTAQSHQPSTRAEDCRDGEYWFYAFDRDPFQQEFERHSACYPVITSGLGPAAANAWPTRTDPNTVRLEYRSSERLARLVVTHSDVRIVGFEVGVGAVRVRYEASKTPPAEVEVRLGDVEANLLAETSLGHRLVLGYRGAGLNAWTRVTLTPDVGLARSYVVHSGELWAPDGAHVGGFAPGAYDAEVRFAAAPDGTRTIQTRWSSDAPATLRLAWNDGSGASALHVDRLTTRASLDVHFRNGEDGRSIGTVVFDSDPERRYERSPPRVPRIWLPTSGDPLVVANVSRIRADWAVVDVASWPPCDADLANEVSASGLAVEGRQWCLAVATGTSGAELRLDGSRAVVHRIPTSSFEMTFGPSGAIHVVERGEPAAWTEPRASLHVRASKLLKGVRALDAHEVVELRLVPGETLASGAGACACGDGGRSRTRLEAGFAPTGGVLDATLELDGATTLTMSMGGLTRISTDLDVLDMDFIPAGGYIHRFALDMTNGASPMTTQLLMHGLTSLRLWHGSGASPDSAKLMLTRIVGPMGGHVWMETVGTFSHDFCGKDRAFTYHSEVSSRDGYRWTIHRDLDIDGFCFAWRGTTVVEGAGAHTYAVRGTNVATYRLRH